MCIGGVIKKNYNGDDETLSVRKGQGSQGCEERLFGRDRVVFCNVFI